MENRSAMMSRHGSEVIHGGKTLFHFFRENKEKEFKIIHQICPHWIFKLWRFVSGRWRLDCDLHLLKFLQFALLASSPLKKKISSGAFD